jgi:hypothetical protein
VAASRYAWVEGDDLLAAACFTVILGIDADEVARRFGGDLSTERSATFERAFNDYPETQYLVFDVVEDSVVAAENNGWEGARPDVAAAVSRGGLLSCVYWSVNADMTFLHAVDGNVIAWLDVAHRCVDVSPLPEQA